MILGYDYKIWARALALRIESVIDKLIGPQQCGFMKGRNIASCIRKTEEVLAYANKCKKRGIIVTIDYEKCFDRVEYTAIAGTLRYFNFGENFIANIFLLFNDFYLCTQNNGYTSNFFRKGRGVNQGCNASPLIFILCGELMAHLIKQNINIKGITVYELEQILSQFADDTTVFLDYDQRSLNELCRTLTHVEQNLGLKVSYDKTNVYRVGTLVKSNARLYTQQNFRWTHENIDILGVKLSCDGEPVRENFDKIVEKIKLVCETWYNRKLSLMGKILVINSLMGSLFVYKMSTMLYIEEYDIIKIEKLFHNYLWGGRRARISMKTLQKKKTQGGLRLVNLRLKQDALLIKWVTLLENDVFLQNCAYANLCPIVRNVIWKCNIEAKDIQKCFENSFWKRVLTAWSKLNYKNPNDDVSIKNQIIWYNSFIKLEGRPFLWRTWWNKGIIFVEDLLNETSGEWLSYEMLVTKFGVINWLEYNTIKALVPKTWLNTIKIKSGAQFNHMYTKVLDVPKVSRFVYDLLIDDDNYVCKYLDQHEINITQDQYLDSFKGLYECTNVTKFRDFQYRLLLGKIVNNENLFKWGLKESDCCSFGCPETENYKHLFYECAKTRTILEWIENIAVQNNVETTFTYETIMLGKVHVNRSHILNFITLMGKQFLYRQRCLQKNVRLNDFIAQVDFQHKIELFNSKRNMRISKHIKKWSPIKPELKEMYDM